MRAGSNKAYGAVLDDRVDFNGDEIIFHGKLMDRVHRHFQVYLNKARNTKPKQVMLDFSRCTNAYPNSMVPLIADVQSLLTSGVSIRTVLPKDENMHRLFLRTNWAHYLSPAQYGPSDDVHYRHLSTKQFRDFKEQQSVVNEFIDVAMRTLEIDRPFLQGLEWSINEITDNVINHAECKNGGFIQLASYKENERVAFCVADSGRGILDSLREAYPALHRDKDAIADAVRAGVTRNRDFGQGNGLSGSLKIVTASNGHFAIGSGCGYVNWSGVDPKITEYPATKRYRGTFVDVQIPLGHGIDIASLFSEHLGATKNYSVVDIIDLKYLSDDAKSVVLLMSAETVGFGSRHSGQQMRIKIKNLMSAEPHCPVIIDWDGVQIISSSYADEFLGKLFVELGPMTFMSTIKQKNMTPTVAKLIDMAIMQRTQQEMGKNG